MWVVVLLLPRPTHPGPPPLDREALQSPFADPRGVGGTRPAGAGFRPPPRRSERERAASSPPPATTGVALVVSPTAEAEAAVDALIEDWKVAGHGYATPVLWGKDGQKNE